MVQTVTPSFFLPPQSLRNRGVITHKILSDREVKKLEEEEEEESKITFFTTTKRMRKKMYKKSHLKQ